MIRLNNIITIKGVFLADLEEIDALYEVRPISAHEFVECVRENVYTNYSAIPKRFTTVSEWPKMTNLKCWVCDRTFTTYPKFIPIAKEITFERGSERVSWISEGNFCEWNCVIDHIRTRKPKNNQWDLEHNTGQIASIFEKKKISLIVPSPPKTEMKQYCGENGITERQYSEKIARINAEYELSSYKISQLKEV
jgi:hypothetical protein